MCACVCMCDCVDSWQRSVPALLGGLGGRVKQLPCALLIQL